MQLCMDNIQNLTVLYGGSPKATFDPKTVKKSKLSGVFWQVSRLKSSWALVSPEGKVPQGRRIS